MSGSGGIDILVNCVGIQIRGAAARGPTRRASTDVYAAEPQIGDVPGPGRSKAARSRQGAGGRQIHLLSVRSQLALRGKGYSAYCTTKGGLVMLVPASTRWSSQPHGITVNGVAPTFVNNRMDPARLCPRPRASAKAILAHIPLGRIADPKDVVGAALFFASPRRRPFVTGQVLYVDGGITASQ